MGRKPKDYSQYEFKHCKPLYFVSTSKRGAIWHFKCECGKEFENYIANVKYGTTSCGCRKKKNGGNRKIHGMYQTRLYRIWNGMKQRCTNPKNKKYTDYGGRGIKVCNEWNNFVVFREWAMANGYCDNLSIDRIDNDGNYEPNNCRWATSKEQADNKRSTRKITYKGEQKTFNQLAETFGLPPKIIRQRIDNYGWSVEKALTTPYKPRKGVIP